MRPRSGCLVGLSAFALAACAPAPMGSPQGVPCKVTTAPTPAFVPPAPYAAQPPPEYAGQFWYGTADLWTMLRSDGVWGGLPQSGGGYLQKVFWWSAVYNGAREPVPDLVVSGRRLDGPSAPLAADGPTNAYADFGQSMLVGVTLPEPGCWELTGRYRGHDLSFVVQVDP